MSKILKRFVHYLNESDFLTQLNSDGGFDDSCIVFIKDKQKIYTHGQYYNCGYSTATEETDGLLSKEDKQWIDIAKGNGEHNGWGFYVPGEIDEDPYGYLDIKYESDRLGLEIYAIDATDNNTTLVPYINAATTTSAGVMSAADKTKLDNLDSTGVAKLKTARTISVGTALTSTPTSFNGTSNITIPVTKIDESYLDWGSRSHYVMSPLDMCFEGGLHGNVFSFMPSRCITVEYSRDGGTTWKDYSTTSGGSYDISDDAKTKILTNTSSSSYIIMGCRNAANLDTSNDRLRVTFDFTNSGLYFILKKIALYVSTNGSQGCTVKVESRSCKDYTDNVDAWTTHLSGIALSGWSGWNVINTSILCSYSDTTEMKKRQLRLTFSHTSHPASSIYGGFQVIRIFGFASELWSHSMQYQKTGHLYDIGADKSATFPGYVKSTKFVKSGGEANQILMANGDTIDKNTLTYTLPIASSSTLGGIKIGYPKSGKNYPVESDDSNRAYVNVPWTDTDTHYTTHLYAGSGSAANATTTNGNTKLTVTDNSTVRNSVTIKGTGATTVTSDANGAITVNSTNTVYSHPTTTALTGKPTANQTPGFGDSVTVSQVISNNLGHVTAMTDRTIKIPNTLATSSKPGLMSGDDKTKLDNIDKYITDISVFQGSEFPGSTKLLVTNNENSQTFKTLPEATYMYSGLMSSDDKGKIDKLYDNFYESEQVILSYNMSYANPLRAAFTNTTSDGSADIGYDTTYYIEIADMLKELKTKLDSDSSITGGNILLNFHDSTKSECYYLEMPSKGTIDVEGNIISSHPNLYLTNRGGYRQELIGSDVMVYTSYAGDSKYTTTKGWTKATISADGLMAATDKEKFDFLSKKCSGITFTFSGSNQKFVIDGETVTLVSGKEYPYLWDLKASSMTGAYTISTSRAKYNFCNEMISMFEGMSGLTSLNLTNFDSAGVTNMYRMFFGCSGLTSLDLKNLNTSKVTNMQGMFYNCSGLTSLEVYDDSTGSSKFVTSMVTNMSAMFQNCSNLTTLNIFNMDSSNVTTTSNMFSGCSKLTTLTFDALNLGGVRTLSMFRNCTSLTELTGLYNVDGNLDLSACPLTVSSAVSVISNLATVTKTTTLKLKASTYSALTTAQIKVATDKGWTVTSV